MTCMVEEVTSPASLNSDAVGMGEKLVQFFYRNPVDNSTQVFPPVQVNSDKEVRFVVALVIENSKEFTMRVFPEVKMQPIQYSTEAAVAKTVLPDQVVKHIKKCFTKTGMRLMKVGRRNSQRNQRNILKRKSKLKGVNADVKMNDVEEVEDAKDDEEVVVEENVPTSDKILEELEERVFGEIMPKVKHGRTRRIEKADQQDGLVLRAVDYILQKKKKCKELGMEDVENEAPAPPIFKTLKKRWPKRGRIIPIDFNDLSDDDDEDFKVSNIKKADGKNRRKSERLKEREYVPDNRCMPDITF